MSASKRVLSAKEAAQYLGVTMSQLYNLTHTHQIPYYKPSGKLIFFTAEELEAYALQNRVSTQSELQSEAAARIKRNTKRS